MAKQVKKVSIKIVNSQRFNSCHEAGARRHGRSWICGNSAAIRVIQEFGLDSSDREVKTFVSLLVLRVLDATHSHEALIGA